MEENTTEETILAEEEAVKNKGIRVVQVVKMALDVGKETEGTLLLTNRRLIYVQSEEQDVDLPIGVFSKMHLIYSDVMELNSIALAPGNFSIHIDSVISLVGHHAPAMAPKLEVKWNEGGQVKVTEFIQQITGGSRRKNLNDWAAVIERLKSGKQKLRPLPPLPNKDSLEGKIIYILGDMQEKGLLTIEREIEEKFRVDLDPDQVELACDELVKEGLLRERGTQGEDPFYQKVSPLADEDLDI